MCGDSKSENLGLKEKNNCTHDEEHHIDELLESIWDLREKGKVTSNHFEESGAGKVILKNMNLLQSRLLVKLQDGHIKFTDEGEKRARNIVRRHRLTERMLTDLFEIPHGNIEAPSCEFEHILSDEVTDSICSFLGHPPKCPHGKPIPPGECCNRIVKTIRPLVMPLGDLMPGEKGRIVFIASKDRVRLQRLSSLGIVPESIVVVNQKLPTLVIQSGETEIAIDRSLVSEIFVKRVNGGA
ncbi:MAG: metal-dependent transcriptional regulator [Firmicutes bacterium]|nr:metal-dependent transcriptional regulator [Bacillota bacterium]